MDIDSWGVTSKRPLAANCSVSVPISKKVGEKGKKKKKTITDLYSVLNLIWIDVFSLKFICIRNIYKYDSL